jgi:hypothetical protein
LVRLACPATLPFLMGISIEPQRTKQLVIETIAAGLVVPVVA